MRVVIMGCGRTGALLAGMLDTEGHAVTVVDPDEQAFARLPDGFSGDTVLGNALDQDVLREAGLESAQVFVAATSGDNRNIMASQVAQRIFCVPRVVARVKDPDRAKFYGDRGILIDCRTSAGSRAVIDLVEAVALQ